MKYHELTLNNSDAQFLESRKFSRSEIASIFRVPPHKIGDLDKATFSNIEQQSLEFVNDTMTPWAERWESSIETFLMFDGEDLEVEFDFANLLRGDSAARALFLKSGINDGWMTRNEARISEGLNPIEGLDEPLRPLNMVENNQADRPDVIPAVATPIPDARMSALVHTSAQRLARRAAGQMTNKTALEVFDAKFCGLIADALAIADAKADAFCQWAQTHITADTVDIEGVLTARLCELGEAGQPAPDQNAAAITRLAAAISAQPAQAAPVVNVTVPERSVEVHQPITLQASIDATRSVTKTVVTTRHADGTLVSQVKED